MAARGKPFETQIEWKNEYYKSKKYGIVQKVPTPMKILGVKPPLYQCVYDLKKSTVDFIGWLKGHAVCFEAKEIRTSSFPFSNLKEHQQQFLLDAQTGGAKSFLLINFENHKKVYLLFINDYVKYKNSVKRKSIPLVFFSEKGILLDNLDYLSIISE